MFSGEETFDFEIEIENTEPLGAVPNEKLEITRVQPETFADGKLLPGDKIISANDVEMHTLYDLASALEKPVAKLVVRRGINGEQAKSALTENNELPMEYRDGYAYVVAKLIWTGHGSDLGLGLKEFQNRVLVTRCNGNSMVEHLLKVGDRIVDISGYPVTDKDVTSQLIIQMLLLHGEASLTLERPISVATIEQTNAILSMSTTQPRSMQMNSDVRRIAKREAAQWAVKKQVYSILKAGIMGRVTINEEPQEHLIGCDYDYYDH